MGRNRKRNSIIGRINQMSRTLLLVLGIPTLISLVLMLVFMRQYDQSIQRMGTIAELKPVIAEDIPESVWNMVSGRETLEESTVYDLIARAEDTITQISGSTGENDRLALIVAGRTMDTLTQYVNRICRNLENGVAVVENEDILTQIRSVAALVESMLNNYITEEIASSAAMSRTISRLTALAAVVEAILVLLSFLISRHTRIKTESFVGEPIRKLESVTAQLAEGNLEARIPETDVVELRNLTDQVNIMADRLETMMEQSVRDERNLKKAELRTLQAQINPHFLYNTLDAIVWKAESGEQQEVIHLTGALSDFFRISLSSGADWIPISQERKHIAGYLSIQQTRYRDILKYDIDLPDEIGNYYILKLLLQPLVENALYHGIKFKRGGGRISVSGRKEGHMLVLIVRDTGIGMDQETLSMVRKRLSERQPIFTAGGNGFGLVNVNLRLRLYYNLSEGLHIDSGPEGTVVTVRVPCRTREDIENDPGLSG